MEYRGEDNGTAVVDDNNCGGQREDNGTAVVDDNNCGGQRGG